VSDSVLTALRDVIVHRYDELKRRLTWQLGSADLAGEALHDTWLRLENSDSHASPVKSPVAYLLRMASNAAVDRMRSERRHLSGEELDSLVGELVDPAPGPAQIAMARADLEKLAGIIDTLPVRRRAILVAVRMQGTPQQEVADQLGISERMVSRELKAAHDYCTARMGR
jgi:RNA polymerase sigma factor (sigma-70 family)